MTDALESFAFTLIGPPQPKQRARACSDGRHRTPATTRRYENAVRLTARLASARTWPLEGIYRVTITLYFDTERQRDVDNCAKAVLDGMNGVAYRDDSLVTELRVTKHIDRDKPRTEVLVERIGDAPVRKKARRA